MSGNRKWGKRAKIGRGRGVQAALQHLEAAWEERKQQGTRRGNAL